MTTHENLLTKIMDSDVNIRHSIVTDIAGKIITTSHREEKNNGDASFNTRNSKFNKRIPLKCPRRII
jgi:hypothetical protein